MQVKEDVQMIPEKGIEICGARIVLGVARIRRFGKRSSHQKRSRAKGAVIVLTRAGRRLTVFILNHGRPVGADYSPHQLGVILAGHTRRS
jgi:hypothetical protein